MLFNFRHLQKDFIVLKIKIKILVLFISFNHKLSCSYTSLCWSLGWIVMSQHVSQKSNLINFISTYWAVVWLCSSVYNEVIRSDEWLIVYNCWVSLLYAIWCVSLDLQPGWMIKLFTINGLFPVWTIKCVFKVLALLNDLTHVYWAYNTTCILVPSVFSKISS